MLEQPFKCVFIYRVKYAIEDKRMSATVTAEDIRNSILENEISLEEVFIPQYDEAVAKLQEMEAAGITGEELRQQDIRVREARSLVSGIRQQIENAKNDLKFFEDAETPQATQKDVSSVNYENVNKETDEKYQQPNNTNVNLTNYYDEDGENEEEQSNETEYYVSNTTDSPGTRSAPVDTENTPPKPATPTWNGKNDYRARLKVPVSYLQNPITSGPNKELFNAQGIIFPYTPQISQDYKAVYSNINAVHSNYTQYFYKNSSVGEITLNAKFTVQNEIEAGIYLSIVHLLRSLTKMKFGNDANAGSPPPVCRLYAYGTFMFSNVPVTLTSFRLELPDNVDYFTTGKKIKTYDISNVPVLSNIQMTLTPIYSRNEMRQATVKDWLTGAQRRNGFL